MSLPSGKDIQRIIIDAADAILLGVPSSVLLGNIRKDYDMEYKDALNLVEQLQRAINEENVKMEDYLRDKEGIMSQIMGYSPVGEFRKTLLDKYNAVDKAYAESVKRSSELNQQMVNASNKASFAASERGNTLGTEAEKRGVLL